MAQNTIRNGISGFFRMKSFNNFSTSTSTCVPATASRTKESNPTNHTQTQIGLFYTIPENEHKVLFTHGGFTKTLTKNLDTFGETSLMIRQPAIDIINFMKQADYNRPAIRYVLYGRPGCGKSVSLAHVIHYAHKNKFLIFHVPWVWDWFRNSRIEVTASPTKEGLLDLPLKAAAWLKHFNSQNNELLSELNLRISKDYIWNQREKTERGSSVLDIVNHGINRVKYACGCVDALVEEIKLACNEKKCKALVGIDGFNALLGTETQLKDEDKLRATPDRLLLTHSFFSLVKQDWINGAVIVILDQMAGPHKKFDCHFPLYLIGRKGFEMLDPFLSVQVAEMTDMEVNSLLDYYEDRRWLQRLGGRKELSFISNNNPYQLMNLCAPL